MDKINGRAFGMRPVNSMWDKTIAEQAAAWVERIRSGEASIQEQASFVAWIDESPAHADAYDNALRCPAGAAIDTTERDRALARRRRLRRFAAAASALLAGCVFVVVQCFDGEISTRAGEVRSVTLEDGSTIQLAGATRIREDFTGVERRVQLLEGQALFQVTRNPERPFQVDAGLQVVQAIGTEFDVSRNENRVEVAVSEGIVAVTTRGMADATGPAVIKLTKGQAVAFQGAVATGGVRQVPVDRIGAWKDGALIFESVPFSRLLDAMGRQYGGHFTVDDPALANKSISVSFAPQDKKEAVRLVERALSLQAVERPGDTTTFIKAPRAH
jgi:transmembrane sensor